jgi:hypothetical protein
MIYIKNLPHLPVSKNLHRHPFLSFGGAAVLHESADCKNLHRHPKVDLVALVFLQSADSVMPPPKLPRLSYFTTKHGKERI